MVDKLSFFLGAVQTAFGTAETLTADDLLIVKDGSGITVNPTSEKVDNLIGKFDQGMYNPGTLNTDCKAVVYLGSSGAAITPLVDKFFKAGGMSADVTTITADSKYQYKYTSTSTFADMSFDQYRLPVNASDNIIKTSSSNIIWDWEVELSPEKGPLATFSGKGTLNSEETITVANKPAIDNTIIYKEYNTLPNAITLGDTGYKATSIKISSGSKLEQFIDWENIYGFGESENTDRTAKITLTVYSDSTKTLPLSYLSGQTIMAFTSIFGPTGLKTKFYAASTQVINYKQSKVGNLSAWELELAIIGNDFFFLINSDLTA